MITQHISELLGILINECTNGEALAACSQINTDDFGSNWQAVNVITAIIAAAQHGNPNDALTASNIGAQLLEAGDLTNESLRLYWLNLAFPDVPYRPIGAHRIPRLIARIVEDHFRTRIHEFYGWNDVHDAPLDELTQRIDSSRQELLTIFNRMNPVALSIVREQSA